MVSFEKDKRLVAIKNVTVNEPFFPGHFPHYHVMPGVLIIEAMAQAAAVLSLKSLGHKNDGKWVYYFVGIDGARFKRPVVPGDQLAIEVEQGRVGRGMASSVGVAKVGDAVLLREAELLCAAARRCMTEHGRPHRCRHATSHIHPTAIVDARAELARERRRVGPYTVIDGDVEIGEGTTIGAHNVITGHTTIGRDNRIFHFCSIGEANQDKKYAGEPTALEIGDRNTIREYCTDQSRHGAGRGRHAPRQRQLDHGVLPHRARLPGRQPHRLRQQRDARAATCSRRPRRCSAASSACTSS